MKLKKAQKQLLEAFSQQDVFLLKIRLSARASEKRVTTLPQIFPMHMWVTHTRKVLTVQVYQTIYRSLIELETLLHRSWGISGILPPNRILISPLRRNISESHDWEFSSLKMEGNFSMKRIFLQVHSFVGLMELWVEWNTYENELNTWV